MAVGRWEYLELVLTGPDFHICITALWELHYCTGRYLCPMWRRGAWGSAQPQQTFLWSPLRRLSTHPINYSCLILPSMGHMGTQRLDDGSIHNRHQAATQSSQRLGMSHCRWPKQTFTEIRQRTIHFWCCHHVFRCVSHVFPLSTSPFPRYAFHHFTYCNVNSAQFQLMCHEHKDCWNAKAILLS